MFEDDIRRTLAQALSEGRAHEITQTQPWFDCVERGFPAGLNRIAWEKVAVKHHAEVFPVATGGKRTTEVEARLASHRDEVRLWMREAAIADTTEVTWIGDMTDIGVTMTVGVMLEFFPKLFSLPQHAYVLPVDGSWCLNYVMEGELFFAKAVRLNELGHEIRPRG